MKCILSHTPYAACAVFLSLGVAGTASNAQEFTCEATENSEYQYEDTLYVNGSTGYYSYRSSTDGALTVTPIQCGFSGKFVVCRKTEDEKSTTHYSIQNLREYTVLTTTTLVLQMQDTLPSFPHENLGVIESHPVRCVEGQIERNLGSE